MTGEQFKKRREELGLELKDAAQTLRINIRYLRAIEEDDLSKLPADVYIRGYVNVYAKLLGISHSLCSEGYSGILREREKPDKTSAPQKGKHIRPLFLLAVSLIAAAVFVFSATYFYIRGGAPLPPGPDTGKPASDELKISQTKPSEIQPQPAYRLSVTAVETTWLRVEMDNGRHDEALLRPSDMKEWTSQTGISIKIGNAGGIRMVLNGKDIGIPGKSGQVMRFSFPDKESPPNVQLSGRLPDKE